MRIMENSDRINCTVVVQRAHFLIGRCGYISGTHILQVVSLHSGARD